MGVDYTQYCMVGVALETEQLKHVIAEEVVEHQPRYNTKTGKQTHTEPVVVKDEVYEYRYGDWVTEDTRDLVEMINDNDDLCATLDDDGAFLYLGKFVSKSDGWGRVSLLEGCVSFKRLLELKAEVEQLLPNEEEIKLHFFTHVG